MGICRSLSEFTDWLEPQTNVNIIVMEKFKLFKHLALQQSGSKMEVAQAEGIVKSYARRNHIEVVEQFSNILTIAVKWTKAPLPKTHSQSHGIAAYNHGFYYLVCHNMTEIVL